jgi:GNAT superfamily N-acetyltransferase
VRTLLSLVVGLSDKEHLSIRKANIMDICILQKKDPETIAKLNRDVQEKHLKLFPNSFKEYDYLSILKAIKSFLDREESLSFIAYFKEEPIGYATVFERKYEENPFRKRYTSIVIDQMCVKKEFRAKGVGSRLVTTIRDYAKQRGIDKLELSVWNQNEEAKSFYIRMGFSTLIDYMRMKI